MMTAAAGKGKQPKKLSLGVKMQGSNAEVFSSDVTSTSTFGTTLKRTVAQNSVEEFAAIRGRATSIMFTLELGGRS